MSVEIDAVRGKELLCFQRPGPKRGAERTVDRLDVARCQLCHTHHDADHECQSCGEATPTPVAQPDRPQRRAR